MISANNMSILSSHSLNNMGFLAHSENDMAMAITVMAEIIVT